MTHLLPCPFCTGVPHMDTIPYRRHPNVIAHYVVCTDCGAQGAVREDEKFARESWNSRFSPEEISAAPSATLTGKDGTNG